MSNSRHESLDYRICQELRHAGGQSPHRPVTITKNGRDRLVMLSSEEYARLKRRDRRVVRLEEFTDEEMALIAKAEAPAEHSHLDDDLKDWHP